MNIVKTKFSWLLVILLFPSWTDIPPGFFDASPEDAIDKVNLIAAYKLSFKEDSTNVENIRQEELLLFLGDTISAFQSKNKYLADIESNNILEDWQKNVKTMAEYDAIFSSPDNPFLQLPRTRFNFTIYKNYPEGKITTTDYVLPDNYSYTEPLDLFHWELTDKEWSFLGYKVQQAVTDYAGRRWVAWFAPQIPYNDGPYKFRGLPGLIIKLHDDREHYVFQLTSIERPDKDKNVVYVKNRGFVSTREQFLKARESFRNSIISAARDAGLDEQSQNVAAENIRRGNNPLELKP